MGQLVFQATLGGQVNLVGPNTASTLNINVPAFAGTMASLASVTANGVAYVNSSGQPTSGSAFVFDGTNVGIGVAPSYKLDVGGAVNSNSSLNVNNTTTQSNILFASTGQTGTTPRSNVIGRFQSTATGRDVCFQFSDNVSYAAEIGMVGGQLYFATGGSERMRIDSSGNVMVGATSTVLSSKLLSNFVAASNTGLTINETSGSSSTTFAFFSVGSTAKGSITWNGSAVLFTNLSDYRLKKNIVNAPEFGSIIDSIQVRSFDWKSDGNHQRAGFIAQELVIVAPEAVYQPKKEEDMMAVDYSKLVPMLVKEIQSLRKRITALESK
jgi:hypothetical protein